MDAVKTGELIRTIRREKNMTQQELADILHVSAPAVSKYENGKGFPDISLLEPLAAALDITVSELLSGERGKIPDKQEDAVRNVIRQSAIQKESGRKKVHRRIFTSICILAAIFLYAAIVYRPVRLTRVFISETQAVYRLSSSRIAFTSYINDNGTVKRITTHGFHRIPNDTAQFMLAWAHNDYGLNSITCATAGQVIPSSMDEDTYDDPMIPMNWTEGIVLDNQEQIIGIDHDHSLAYPLQYYLENKDFHIIITARRYGWSEHSPDYE